MRFFWIFFLLVSSSCYLHADEASRLFVEKIRPLFQEKCAGCHGDRAKKIKGEFDMRTLDGLLAGGESGDPALVPGSPERSPLYLSVLWEDPDFEMPPKENDRLSESQIADLHRWIKLGAPWVEQISQKQEIEGPPGTWSKPDAEGKVRVKLSPAENELWANRGYDPAKLWAFRPPKKQALPAGIHPIDFFINRRLGKEQIAPAPRAPDRILARRLAYTLTGLPPSTEQLEKSPEILIEEFLASPRHGERMAQHWLDVTRYADSNGFARDDLRPQAHLYRTYVIKSFNSDKPFSRFIKEQIAGDELELAGQDALSFLWMGPFEMTAMTSRAVARQMWLDDVVNSIGVTFLGQELRCAKCHDHKFDPIPTHDYYALQAVFASTRHHLDKGKYKIRSDKPETISILKGGSLETPTDPVQPGLLSALTPAKKVTTAAKGRRAELAGWIASPDNSLTARVIVNRVWAWHFGRGLVATPNGFGSMGAKPSHPELLDFLATWFIDQGWSLKKLHRLILSSEAWQRSTKHPELQKIRQADPDNLLLSTFPPRRLTAEEIRDSMLVASGELSRQVGGESFRAEINWEVAFQPRLAMGKVLPPYEPDPKRIDRNRRSLYAIRIRNLGHPLMEVLNRPPTELSCERRDETTVVTQAFSLFHGEFSNERALALANWAAQENSTLETQINYVFLKTLARKPSSAELVRCLSHHREMLSHHQDHPPKKTELPKEVTVTNVIEKTGESTLTKFQLKRLKNYERDLQPWQVDAQTRALAELALVLLNSSEFLHVY